MANAYNLTGEKQEQGGGDWRNRIVGYGTESPDQFLANDLNARVHPEQQQRVVAGLLNGVGWVDEVMVNVRSGEAWPVNQRNVKTVVDGHLRIVLALRRNEESVPVKYVDLNPDKEAAVLAAYDYDGTGLTPRPSLSAIDPFPGLAYGLRVGGSPLGY